MLLITRLTIDPLSNLQLRVLLAGIYRKEGNIDEAVTST